MMKFFEVYFTTGTLIYLSFMVAVTLNNPKVGEWFKFLFTGFFLVLFWPFILPQVLSDSLGDK